MQTVKFQNMIIYKGHNLASTAVTLHHSGTLPPFLLLIIVLLILFITKFLVMPIKLFDK